MKQPTISQVIHRRLFLMSAFAVACTKQVPSLSSDKKAKETSLHPFAFSTIPPFHDNEHHHSPELQSQILLYWGMHLFENEDSIHTLPNPMMKKDTPVRQRSISKLKWRHTA